MIGFQGRLLRGVVLLSAALLLALLPGPSAGTAAGMMLALLLPGYAVLQCLRTPARLESWPDLLNCVAASLAITPLSLRLAGLLVPFDRAHLLVVLAGVTLGLLVLGAARPRGAAGQVLRTAPRPLLLILIATLLLLAPTLAIGPTRDGGETCVKGWDLNNHLAIAESIASRGLPPQNPFLNSDSPFYYHTFFHILLAALLVIAGKGVHAYLLIACLVLLLAAVFLTTFHRVVSDLAGDERVAFWALPLVSVVGGFDLIPMLGRLVLDRDAHGAPAAFFLRHWNVDGWVSNRGMLVPSLFASFYWVPHAVAAMVVFLLALLYLRRTETGTAALAVAGACLASMAGYNGYVALGGAATVALLRVSDLIRFISSRFRIGRDVLLRSALVGGLAILLGLPVLSLYAGERGGTEKFRWARPGPWLPLQIALEFGPALILGLAGLFITWRREDRDRALTPFLLMGIVSLPVLCLVASTGENNDLAMRISMFLWVGLAAFGGLFLNQLFPRSPSAARSRRVARCACAASLLLGSLSVVWFAMGAAIAKPTLPADEVAAGRWVQSTVPPGRLVQGSPLRENPELVYLTGHPAALSDTWAARLFYAQPEEYARRMTALQAGLSAPDPEERCAILRSLGVTTLVVGPPERRDFPLLGDAERWPCLSKRYEHGAYQVYGLP